MKYNKWIFKRNVEHLLLIPFILIGKILYRVFDNNRQQHDIYLFFPFYHTGGAEYVHAQITQALKHQLKGKIYFTRRSQNEQFKKVFEESGWEIQDISKWTDHKLWYYCNLIMRGYIAAQINADTQAKYVFNGQSNFGYKISPWIQKRISQIELIHSYNSFSAIRVPYIEYYTQTVMIAQSRVNDHLAQYDRLNIPSKFKNNIILIQNGIRIPAQLKHYPSNQEKLKVLYVGRSTPEKRVQLVIQAAEKLQSENIEFGLVGHMDPSLLQELPSNINLYGNISDPKELENIYQSYDVLLITSITEGMPIVVQEAMANGLAIIGTPVGDIPYEVKNGVNGFVLSSYEDESLVVSETVEQIKALNNNRSLLTNIIEKNQIIAREKYGFDRFQEKYERLFNISTTD